MPFPPLLTRQLSVLSATLTDSGSGLESALTSLVGQLNAVAPGFLGLTITVYSHGLPITLTAVEPADLRSARSCLLLALHPAGGASTGSSVVFYAATAGAFRTLIENTDPGCDGLDGVFILDQHLPVVTDLPHPVGISGMAELTALNRSLGALIEQGCTLRQAHAELRRRAAA